MTAHQECFPPLPFSRRNIPTCVWGEYAAAENLRRLEEQLVAACAALKRPPDALMGETQTRLDAMCEAAAVELGREVKRDEAKFRARYDLTLREITRRLKAERDKPRQEGAEA